MEDERLGLILEEQQFPYSGLSLEEAREIRYLVGNIDLLNDGEIVHMSLDFVPESRNDKAYVRVNGLFKGEHNKSFMGNFYVLEHKKNRDGYSSYLKVIDEVTQEDKVIQTEFLYLPKSIVVANKIMTRTISEKEIPYPNLDNKKTLK